MDPLLKAVETLNGASGPKALCDRLAAVTQPRGYPLYAIGWLTGERRREPRHFALNNFPEAWFEKYRDYDFKVEDPINAACVKSAAPFTLADLREGRTAHRPCAEAIRLMGIFDEVGSPEGYVVPVYGPFGYRGKVCYFGTVADPGPAERMALRLLAIHVHDRLRDMPEAGEPGPLTRREVAVLRAARSGLGDEEIAACLGIGLRTVRFHFENARRKLGARTRLQAVAEAVERGIL